MPRRLLKTTKETYSGVALAKYVNKDRGTHYDNISEAVAAFGITVVSAILNPGLALTIALQNKVICVNHRVVTTLKYLNQVRIL